MFHTPRYIPHAHVGGFVRQRVHDVVNGVHADGRVVLLVHRHGNSAATSRNKRLRCDIVVLQRGDIGEVRSVCHSRSEN